MSVDPKFHPKIIGRKGAVISQIRKDHDVSIQFPDKGDEQQVCVIPVFWDQVLSFDCIPSSTTDFACSSSGPDRDLGVRAQRGGGAPGHPAAGGRAAGDGEPRGSPGPEDPRSHHRSPRQSHTQADGGVQGSGVLFPVRAKL